MSLNRKSRQLTYTALALALLLAACARTEVQGPGEYLEEETGMTEYLTATFALG